MLQEIIIGFIFLGAIFFVGRMFYKNITAESACTTGCSKCGALDLAKIEAELKSRGL
jgi:hypothetical protein